VVEHSLGKGKVVSSNLTGGLLFGAKGLPEAWQLKRRAPVRRIVECAKVSVSDNSLIVGGGSRPLPFGATISFGPEFDSGRVKVTRLLVTMTHKHHITPKYRGGTDDSSNLVEVTVTQHAMFHYCNWQLWGDKRDWLAWKGLTGEISQEERIFELRKLGGYLGGKATGEKPETKERMRRLAHLHREKAIASATTLEAKLKRKKTFEAIQHQQGTRNSQFGRPKSEESNKQRSLKLQKFSSITVKTPEGVKTLTGSYQEMATDLGIPRNSFGALLRKGRLVRLGIKVLSNDLKLE
jgi:hypothetical protein